jgi:hypothetical protein
MKTAPNQFEGFQKPLALGVFILGVPNSRFLQFSTNIRLDLFNR